MSNELPRTFKVVTIWLLLGVLVFVGIQWVLREQQQMRFRAEGDIIEIRRGPDGHYHWPGTINGRSVDFLIDTGATGTAISAALARELELQSIGQVQSSTAGGPVTGQVVRAERLRLVALPQLADRPLLGMDLLGRLHWQQRDGVMRIDLRPTQPS